MSTSRRFELSAFGPPDVMQLVEREVPEPGAGEVVVAVEAA
jgi:NADPH:quinone reductase-like Zn-dependent oxidoreductase